MLDFSLAITFFYRNFVRIRQTLRVMPAMKAGIADHKSSIEEMVDLLPEARRPIPADPGGRNGTGPLPDYRKRRRKLALTWKQKLGQSGPH